MVRCLVPASVSLLQDPITVTHAPTPTEGSGPSALELGRSQQLSLMDLLSVAETLAAAGQKEVAGDLYKTWFAFNDRNPTIHLAYFNYAVILGQLGDRAGAIQALRTCIRIDPNFAPAHINLGRALEDSGQIGAAVEQWWKYAEATKQLDAEAIGHKQMVLQNIGLVLEVAGKRSRGKDTGTISSRNTPDWINTNERPSFEGVVDRSLKAFGLKNRYVAGSSTFPTSGHANPTFTVVAMSLRLASFFPTSLRF